MYKHQATLAGYNGKLNIDQENSLKYHRDYLVNHLQVHFLLDVLVKQSVLNPYDKFIIEHADDTREKNGKFLDILLTKTPQGFDIFMQALLDSGQMDAYNKLLLENEAPLSTDSTAVQTEPETDERDITNKTDNLNASSSSSFLTEQKEHQEKITCLETRVDKLAESVDVLTTEVRESNVRVLAGEETRQARLQRLEEALHTREALLLNASKQMEDLRSKIEEVEQQKSQAMNEAHQTIGKMNQTVTDLTAENERLEKEVQRLTSENQRLQNDMQEIQKEKALVQAQLKYNSEELRAMKSQNQKLEEKLAKSDQTLQFVVNKVERIEMTVESSKPPAQKTRSAVSRRKRRDAGVPAVVQPPNYASAATPVQQDMKKKSGPEPTKQCVAKPNAKRQ